MNANIAEWSQFVAVAIGGAFGLLCLFDGTRRVALGDADGRGGRLFAVGLLIVGLLAGNAYYQHWTYADAAKAYHPEAPRELPADWGKKMTPAKRADASQNMARSAYVSAGALRQHFDIEGQRKAFAPAQDDIKRRDAIVIAAARVDSKVEEHFQQFILWLVLGGSAVVFGIGFALESPARPVEVDERIEPTAPAVVPVKAAIPPSPPAAGPVPAPAAKPPLQPAPPKPAAAVAPPAAAAKPAAGLVTTPMARPAVGSDTVPMAKPAAPADTVPMPKPAANVGDDTVPLPKPPPGAFTPPKKS